jgi:hypothetical protein
VRLARIEAKIVLLSLVLVWGKEVENICRYGEKTTSLQRASLFFFLFKAIAGGQCGKTPV